MIFLLLLFFKSKATVEVLWVTYPEPISLSPSSLRDSHNNEFGFYVCHFHACSRLMPEDV